jgi:HD-like signal output (HDOD) protein
LAQELTRQQRIDACLKEILKQPDFPALSGHIQQVMHALDDEETSLRRLTSLVLRDYSLTLKVLRTANSVQYNRSGRQVLSVSHAVVLLGTQAIRYLAGSLALFEHFRQQSPGLKELMLLSLLTANEARSVAAEIRYPRREEAYLCGMFRNLGEILIASYFPREYASILREMNEQNLSDREACLQVMQFTYDDLGQAMARHWRMPEQVVHCMEAPEPAHRSGTDREADRLSALTAFSHALTTAVYRREPEGARARITLLIEDYLPTLELQRSQVERILDTALLDTKNTSSLLRVPLDHLRLSRQAEAALAGAAEAAAASGPELEELAHGADLLERLTHEVEALLEAPGEFRLNDVLMMILEAVYRSGAFDRVLFCLVNPDHTHIQGRLALGEGADSLRDRFHFSIGPEGGPIGNALQSKQDLFVPRDTSAGHAEPQVLKQLEAASFGLLPVLVDRVLVGCLYFDRLGWKHPPDRRVMRLAEHLRDLAGRAIKKSRTAGTNR